MTSRERVLRSLNHKEPDRVPMDLGGMRSTGIGALAYKRLREYLNINDRPIKLYDVWQQLAWIEEDILEYFHTDVRSIERLYSVWWNPEIKLDEWKKGELTDGTRAEVPKGFSPVKEGKFYVIKNKKGETVAKRSEDGLYYDHVGIYHPLGKAKNTSELKKQYQDLFPEGGGITNEEQDHLRAQSKKLRENTEYALLAWFGASLFEMGQYLRGYEQWYLDIAENKEEKIASSLLNLLLEDHLKALETFISTIKLLPDIIEAGADIINPVHINAKDMQPERLKREFGKDIVFWGGGCDTQKVLPEGNLNDIEIEVKKNISIFAPGGGFVFAAVHNIQPDIPPEKIVKLYEKAYEYSKQVYSASR